MLERLLASGPLGANPSWKSAIPRDSGASWDFEDVRDHYLETLFQLDARKLRATDPERWVELGRIATGEAMAHTIAELRRTGSTCRGALVWHLRDLVPGAGSGVIDASGQPKAAYWFLARAFAPIALFLIDEGLNGLRAHAINDTEQTLNADLRVSFFRNGQLRIDGAEQSLDLPPRSSVELSIDALLGRFIDPSYAYRFGPPSHDVATATLVDRATGAVLADAVHFPLGPPAVRRADLELRGSLLPHPLGFALTLATTAMAYAVHIEAAGYEPADNYFHLDPAREKRVLLRPTPSSKTAITVRVTASNASTALTLRAEQEARRSA